MNNINIRIEKVTPLSISEDLHRFDYDYSKAYYQVTITDNYCLVCENFSVDSVQQGVDMVQPENIIDTIRSQVDGDKIATVLTQLELCNYTYTFYNHTYKTEV